MPAHRSPVSDTRCSACVHMRLCLRGALAHVRSSGCASAGILAQKRRFCIRNNEPHSNSFTDSSVKALLASVWAVHRHAAAACFEEPHCHHLTQGGSMFTLKAPRPRRFEAAASGRNGLRLINWLRVRALLVDSFIRTMRLVSRLVHERLTGV